MKKRIAFVRLRYLPPSETFIYEELKNIKKFKPIVYTRKKMNIRRFPYRKIRLLPRSARRIAYTFKRSKIKLIHARFGNAGVKLMGVRKRMRIPMLTSFHGFDLPNKRNPRKAYHRKLPRLFRTGDKFTVPSYDMMHRLIKWGCPSHKILVQYSGVDLKKFRYYERDPKTEKIRILAVGRLHKKKGLKYLLKAFKKVHQVHPTSRLIIIGDGDERKNLKRLRRKLRLSKYVKFCGDLHHRQIVKQLKKADIFCLPSITTKDGNHEGIPNAIKEAMATGLPIVSTWHGGIPELVTDKEEGYLVPEKSVEGLAEKIMILIKNPALRREMGLKGRSKIERNFDSSKQVRRLESIYAELMKKRRGR